MDAIHLQWPRSSLSKPRAPPSPASPSRAPPHGPRRPNAPPGIPRRPKQGTCYPCLLTRIIHVVNNPGLTVHARSGYGLTGPDLCGTMLVGAGVRGWRWLLGGAVSASVGTWLHIMAPGPRLGCASPRRRFPRRCLRWRQCAPRSEPRIPVHWLSEEYQQINESRSMDYTADQLYRGRARRIQRTVDG